MSLRTRTRQHPVAGLRVHARVVEPAEGASRPDVVLVHGMAVASRSMLPLARRLAARGHRVWAPDMPGFGWSDKPASATPVDGLGRLLGGWLRATGLAPALVVGNSMGTQFAVAGATAAPDTVARLLLLSPTVPPTLRRAAALLLPPSGLAPSDPRTTTPGGSVARGLVRMQRALLGRSESLLGLTPALKWLIVSEYAALGPVRAVAVVRRALADAVEERIPHVDVPVVVFRGESDTLVSRQWARDLAARAPHGRYVEVAGVDHDGEYLRPGRVAEALLPYLSESVC